MNKKPIIKRYMNKYFLAVKEERKGYCWGCYFSYGAYLEEGVHSHDCPVRLKVSVISDMDCKSLKIIFVPHDPIKMLKEVYNEL
jgi:hypothetical protein